VLLGKGNGTFQAPLPTNLGSLSPSSILIGDFSGAGHTDLVVSGSDTSSGQNEVEVLLGNGEGTFQATTPISLGTLSPSSIVAGEFTGDGRADIAIAGSDSSSGENEVEVLLSNGHGTFQATAPTDLGALSPSALAAADFTGNGHIDLAVEGSDSSSGKNEVELLLDNGDGTFQATAPTDLGGLSPSALAAADFTGNGHIDLAVAGSDSSSGKNEVELLLDKGDGTFQATAPTDLVGNLSPSFLLTGDFNGDGHTDLVVIGLNFSIIQPQNDVEVLLGKGNGTFQTPSLLNLGTLSPSSVVAGDLTADGRTDLVVSGSDTLSGQGAVEVLLGQSDGTFQTPRPINLSNFSPSSVLAGDFNGDGLTDLAVAGFDSSSGQDGVDVLLSGGFGRFQALSPINLGKLAPSSVVAGEFTGAGRTDLAAAGFDSSSGQNEAEVLLGEGDGTFQATTPINLGTLAPASLVVGDFDGDGRIDLAVVGSDPSSGQDEVEVLLGEGDGTFHAATPTRLGTLSTHLLVTGEFTGDGRTDVAVVGFDSSSLQTVAEVLRGNGDGTFQATTPINLGSLSPSFLVAGDFTGNGPADLAVAGSASSSGENEVEVLLAKGDGTLQPTTPINLGSL
jgi:hypothetical protein